MRPRIRSAFDPPHLAWPHKKDGSPSGPGYVSARTFKPNSVFSVVLGLAKQNRAVFDTLCAERNDSAEFVQLCIRLGVFNEIS